MKTGSPNNGLHEIKNKRRPHAVKAKRRGGIRFKTHFARRTTKIVASVSAVAVLGISVFSIGSFFFKDVDPNVYIPGFETVSYEVPKDGSKPDSHSALENIGYMNRVFREQTNWYSEMHGVVDTMLTQQVSTYKQYSNDVLITYDITTSKLENSARQFCYVGDDVLWREAAGAASTWATSFEELADMQWKTGEPYAHMTVDDFRTSNGLPATEFSVYIINEETLLGADDVIDNGDGTFTQTYYLDPASDKAPYYYINQMVSTGGLTSKPVFEYITVTYTFDSSWQVLSSDITEKYTAAKGLSVSCVTSYRTEYEYNTEKAISSAYEDYFKEYASKPATGAPVAEITATDCLATAFGSVMTEPTTFAVSLDLNGTNVEGLVYVDVSDTDNMEIRAQIGNIAVEYSGGQVYLSYGGVKVRMDTAELMALVQELLAANGGESAETDPAPALDLDSILESLGSGEFVLGETSASLSANLELFGLSIPVEFAFEIGEERQIALGSVSADIAVGENFSVGAELAFSNRTVPALTAAEKKSYIDLGEYVNGIKELLSSDYLQLEVSYSTDRLSLLGEIVLDTAGGSVCGTLTATADEVSKTVLIGYTDGYVYLNIDGLKFKADTDEALALIGQYIQIPQIETEGFDLNGLIGNLFSEDFAANFTLGEENGLTLLIRGTELLQAFGIEFDLGDVEVGVTKTSLSAKALGASVTLSAGEAFVLDTEGYADIVTYARDLAALFTQENLAVDISYSADGLFVSGLLNVSLSEFAISGTVSLSYGEQTKEIGVMYADGVFYLSADSVKVKADAAELLAAIQALPDLGSISDGETDVIALLAKVLSFDFGELLSVKEEENVLTLTLCGTELMKSLGVEFELGDVSVEIEEGALRVSALGANVGIGKGEAFVLDTADYIDLTARILSLYELFTSEVLRADVSYRADSLEVSGTLVLDTVNFAAKADLTVKADTLEKQLSLMYTEGMLYLAIDGAKISAQTDSVIELVLAALNVDMSDLTAADLDVLAILERVLSADFGELLSMADGEDALRITLCGTKLLELFGVEFDLGEVVLGISDSALTAEALGAKVSISAGEAFVPDTAGYADITPILEELISAVQAQAISFTGQVNLTVGETAVALSVDEGVISWRDGFELYLQLTLSVGEVEEVFYVRANAVAASFAYGALGVEVVYSELGDLADAFSALCDRITAIVGQAIDTGNTLFDDQLGKIEELLGLITGMDAVTEAAQSIDLISVLEKLELGGATVENGVLSLGYEDILLELLLGSEQGGFGVFASYAQSGISVVGALNAAAFEGDLPAMPEINYLGISDFCELLDYVGAAVAAVAEQNVTVEVAGSTTAADGSAVYDFNGTLSYYSGGSFPIAVSTEEQTVTVNADLYLHISFAFVNHVSTADSIYLEFYAVDYDEDEELDLFVTLSRFTADNAAYAPLKLYAPAGEIMTVLSGGLAALGVDVDLIEQYLISNWLDAQTTEQLRAFGGMLKKSLGVEELLDSLLGGLISSSRATVAQDDGTAAATKSYAQILREVSVGESAFVVKLNSSAMYGIEGLQDITIEVTKAAGENGSYLTGFSASNLYDADGTRFTDLSVGISYAELAEKPQPASLEGYYDLTGIAALLKSVANSATHSEEIISGEETQHAYVLNSNFYIDGSVTLNMKVLSLISVTAEVNIVAISLNVDENGGIGVNIRLEYQGVQEAGQVAINGDSTLDLTIKNSMVYMKRTQYSYYQKGTISTDRVEYTTPVVIYRAMPIENFLADFVNQLAFMLNFGDLITSNLPSGEDSGSAETETVDYGTTLSNILASYSYTEADGKDTWTVAINGPALTGDVLENVTINIGSESKADGTRIIRTLDFVTGINVGVSEGVVDIDINGGLTYRNPQGVMDSGVTDITLDIADEAAAKMSQKLAIVDWEESAYVEGGVTMVTFMFNGKTMGTQEVVYNPTTGECYAELQYPDLSNEAQETGYTPIWKAPAKIEGSGTTVYASYQANVYTVTLVSDRATEGFIYDEESGLWKQEINYTYDTTLALPVGYTPDNAVRISAFVDAAENEYESIYNITSDLTLYTVWEKIEYTVTYVADGVTIGEQIAYYGDAFELPAAPDKVGYEFIEWNVTNDSIIGSTSVEAVYQAKQYNVILKSEYAIDGFSFDETSGTYQKQVEFVYDGIYALDSGRGYKDGYFLDGFTLAGSSVVYTAIPNEVIESLVLTAKWSELGYDISFVAEGVTVATQNYHIGDSLNNLPEVPAKSGYSGVWNIDASYIVSGEDTIYASYTPITYVYTIISYEEISGWFANGDYWYQTVNYTYDSDAVTLDTTLKISCFDFGGYFTKANGAGNRIEVLNNETVNTLTLYVYWIDNTVVVTVCSDIVFDGYEGYSAGNGYFKTMIFNDSYDLTQIATASGYQHFGWWTQAEGVWTRVTNVRELNGKQVWAVWIQNDVFVTIEAVSSPSSVWSISGTYTYNWGGQKSNEIIASLEEQIGKTEQVLYVLSYTSIFGTKIDKLNSGAWQNDGEFDGTFSKSSMTSFYMSSQKGGAKVRLTFTFEDLSVTIESADYAWKDKE